MLIDTIPQRPYDAYQQRHRAEAQPTGLQMNQTNNECSSSCSSERYGGAVTCDCKKSAACAKATPHFDYVAEAHLTASPHFYGDRVPLAHFAAVLQDSIDALSALDRIKKALFYGRDLGPLALGVRDTSQNCAKLPDWISSHPEEDEKARNIIHAIIGKATEAGELLELLHKTAVNGEAFDVANAGEEVGDGFWYDALLARACGLTFDGIQRTNIAKLRHRFPDRFTEYDANNRDLFGERRILEEGEKISS
jgi:hypothetical protein